MIIVIHFGKIMFNGYPLNLYNNLDNSLNYRDLEESNKLLSHRRNIVDSNLKDRFSI